MGADFEVALQLKDGGYGGSFRLDQASSRSMVGLSGGGFPAISYTR